MKPNYRRCISCREVKTKESLWRVIRVYPSAEVKLDKGMGRSAYVCPQETCLRTAEEKNRLAKALKTSVSNQIYQQLWERLSQEK